MSAILLRFPEQWFKEMKTLFSNFCEEMVKPEKALKKLTIPRMKGGLGVPDVYWYYLSFNGRYPLSWAYTELSEKGSWKWPEQNLIAESSKYISLAPLWYHPKCKKNINNPLILHSRKIAKELHNRLNISGLSLPSNPIWKNALFTVWRKFSSTRCGRKIIFYFEPLMEKLWILMNWKGNTN